MEHENSIRLIRVWSDLRFVHASARHRIPAAVTPSLAHHPAARPAAPVGTQRCACFTHAGSDQAAPCGRDTFLASPSPHPRLPAPQPTPTACSCVDQLSQFSLSAYRRHRWQSAKKNRVSNFDAARARSVTDQTHFPFTLLLCLLGHRSTRG